MYSVLEYKEPFVLSVTIFLLGFSCVSILGFFLFVKIDTRAFTFNGWYELSLSLQVMMMTLLLEVNLPS